jgi:hypothetical protein
MLYITERVIVICEQSKKIYCKLLSIIQHAVDIYRSHVLYSYTFVQKILQYVATHKRMRSIVRLPALKSSYIPLVRHVINNVNSVGDSNTFPFPAGKECI